MLFCKTFVQKRIAKWSRERNVDDDAHMHMADFSFMESIFSGSKAVRVNGDVWPSGDVLFDAFQSSVHFADLLGLLVRCSMTAVGHRRNSIMRFPD
jgi:hypothetical protein